MEKVKKMIQIVKEGWVKNELTDWDVQQLMEALNRVKAVKSTEGRI